VSYLPILCFILAPRPVLFGMWKLPAARYNIKPTSLPVFFPTGNSNFNSQPADTGRNPAPCPWLIFGGDPQTTEASVGVTQLLYHFS
jgi:hypothetical protein